jgi:aminocarboxymuconate-semialdehyde decarboxylase
VAGSPTPHARLQAARDTARGVTGVIDLHAHAVLEAGFGVAGVHGPELAVDDDGISYFRIGKYRMKPMAYRGTPFMDVGKRLALMDQLGIALQLLSPNPLTMFHRIDAPTAIRFCQVHNDAMAELVAQHPGRLLGAAALPMQDVDAALRELERCVTQLGLVAAHTGTDYPCTLDDPRLDDFYRTLVDLDVPLFLHPASTGGAELPDDVRMARFDLSVLMGYAYEETLAVATLVIGGVLERHPALDICISHGGGSMPYLVERFERMSAFRAWAPPSVKANGFRAAMNRLWFDAHVEGDAALRMLIDVVGTERLVFGTNFGGWDTPSALDPVAASLTANARRLMRLPD